jgi:hypothetical protein
VGAASAVSGVTHTHTHTEGIQGGYASAKQNFPRKTGTAAVRDHGITTRHVDAAESS